MDRLDGHRSVGESITRRSEVQLAHAEFKDQTIAEHLLILAFRITNLMHVDGIGHTAHDSEGFAMIAVCHLLVEGPIVCFEQGIFHTPINFAASDDRLNVEETKRFLHGIGEVNEVSVLDRNLNLHTIGSGDILRGHDSNSRSAFLVEVCVVDTAHTIMRGSHGEVVGVAEGRLATQAKATDLAVGVGLGRSKVDSVDVVDVLMRDACAEVLNSEPRFQRVRQVNVEGLIAFASSSHAVSSVATQLAHDGERFVRIQVRENLKCLLRGFHTELCLVGHVADTFDGVGGGVQFHAGSVVVGLWLVVKIILLGTNLCDLFHSANVFRIRQLVKDIFQFLFQVLWELVARHNLVVVGGLEHGCSMAGFDEWARLFFKFFSGRQTFFQRLVQKNILLPTNIFSQCFQAFYLTPNDEEFFTIPYRNHPSVLGVLLCSNDSPQRRRER